MILHDEDFINTLCQITNALADEIKTIKDKMPGRGVNPAESPLVELRLTEIEQVLRKIGCDKNHPLPGISRLAVRDPDTEKVNVSYPPIVNRRVE